MKQKGRSKLGMSLNFADETVVSSADVACLNGSVKNLGVTGLTV